MTKLNNKQEPNKCNQPAFRVDALVIRDGKPILDATCGSRMMWFNKSHPNAVYADKRSESHILCDGRALEISPDVEMDFTAMPFPDKSFKLVVFDPPHLERLGKSSWMAKKYGKLFPDWETDIRGGFDECMRVLDDYGVLIFKWCERDISILKIIDVIGQVPLFGHPSGRQTIWMTFMKMPN